MTLAVYAVKPRETHGSHASTFLRASNIWQRVYSKLDGQTDAEMPGESHDARAVFVYEALSMTATGHSLTRSSWLDPFPAPRRIVFHQYQCIWLLP